MNIYVSYFLFASVAIVGVLQVMAARHRLVGLSLVREARKPLLGYLLGAVLIMGAFLWFFTTQEGIFAPGPAGAQFLLLFAAAFICALVNTLLLSTAIHRPSLQHRGESHFFHRQRVSLEWGQGTLYIPTGQSPPWPAVCIASSPGGGHFLQGLASKMASDGLVVLVVDLDVNRYPEVLTLLPIAISYLSDKDEVDPERIGAMGVDVGADLAIRAAASDERIKAVAVLAPLLGEENARPGLRLLREMPYLQAMRWSRFLDGGKLLASLETANYVRELSAPPLFVVYGEEDGLVPVKRVHQVFGGAGELRLVRGERHTTLASSPAVSSMVARWFNEKL